MRNLNLPKKSIESMSRKFTRRYGFGFVAGGFVFRLKSSLDAGRKFVESYMRTGGSTSNWNVYLVRNLNHLS